MPPFHPRALLVPSLIAAARADCGMLAQVGSCATGGGGRGGGRYAGEAGGALVARVLRPARVEVVASYHRLHHPSVPLGQLLARSGAGLVVCLRRQAGSPSLVLLKTTQPLPYLASCRASSPTRRTRSL